MGKTELVTGLIRAISGKSTFLQVARTATKGNVVQKGIELQGKQAIKFFEKMPCDFQKYVKTVNPENLSVRYGVKGYNGSSVTGFQVFDGKNIIAKGAMGIDKTYGKRPILQIKAQLFQGEQKAGINFKYDGNKVFNGSASTGSTIKDQFYNMQSNYGNTVNFEYSETNNFSNWLNQHGLKGFDSIETPTARQFAANEDKVHKIAKEFVSGRKTYTPQQREQMEFEKLRRQKCKKHKGNSAEYVSKLQTELNEKLQSAKLQQQLKELLKKEKFPPYRNKEVIEQIKNLKGSATEVAEQSTKIFLKEMGFNPELVEIKQISSLEQGFRRFEFAFEPVSGRILISPSYNGGRLLTSSMIRHELDHFQLFADLCKSMGVENFKKMLLAKFPKVASEKFNTEFWNKAIQNAKILSPAEVAKYTKALEKYSMNGICSDNILTSIKYFGNPIETRAYDIMVSVGKSLGLKTSNDNFKGAALSRIYGRMASALERIEQKTGKAIDEACLEKLYNAEMLKFQGDKFDLSAILNNVLKNLESV